jgi:hypothetical protein
MNRVNPSDNRLMPVGLVRLPEIAESYISTGSLYLCTAVFLPLGLPASDEFWSGAPADWTNKKAWSGKPVKVDHAIKN